MAIGTTRHGKVRGDAVQERSQCGERALQGLVRPPLRSVQDRREQLGQTMPRSVAQTVQGCEMAREEQGQEAPSLTMRIHVEEVEV